MREQLKTIGIFLVATVLAVLFVFSSEQLHDDYINRSKRYIVQINDPKLEKGGGTGFFVQAPSGTTYIMTNNHICNLASAGQLLINNSYVAHVLAQYTDHDLCLVNNPMGSRGLKVAKIVHDGENIYVLGHPLLDPLSLVKGQISGDIFIQLLIGLDLECKGEGYQKIDVSDSLIGALTGAKSLCLRSLEANPVTANILPGNSGSPVLTSTGKIAGVAFAGIDGSARGYIVPLPYVQEFLEGK